MSLEQVLRDGLTRLQQPGALNNEAQIKQSVILPILGGLGWDIYNPDELKPEFEVTDHQAPGKKGRVDYALGSLLSRNPPHPLVFVEAKNAGYANTKGEEQLFSYASNRGVPLLILTDGTVWNFYLSMAAGPPPERLFCRVELKHEEKIHDYVESFQHYLKKDNVLSEDAQHTAERELKRIKDKETARNAIGPCWDFLVSESHLILSNALAEAVEKQCGIRPELDDVEKFLQGLHSTPNPPNPEIRIVVDKKDRPPKPESSTLQASGRIIGYVLDGNRVETGAGYLTLLAILREFDQRDSSFMERFAAKTRTTKRHLVDRNPDNLYIGSPQLKKKYSQELGNGWWLGTNLSKSDVVRYVETACDIVGVKYGSRLTLTVK